MPTSFASGCTDFRSLRATRRAALAVGSAGLAGLGLADLLRAEEAGLSPAATAKSCIMLFQFGGPSHLDTFDPKPAAPAEIRGEFGVISTRNPELRICEHLPKLAAVADRFALVRSVHHDRSSHNPAAYYSLTGRRPLNPSVTANASATDFPAPGAVIDALRRDDHDVPTAVSLPTMIADGPFRTPGEFAGFLGKINDPLFITQDPNDANFSVEPLQLPEGISIERLHDRRAVLEDVSRLARLAETHQSVRGLSSYQQRAVDLLTSPATQRALAIDDESETARDRYGRNQYGQSVLLARRLIEAGVRFATVYYSRGIGGWDTHKGNFKTLKDSRLPQTDMAVSSLIDDLDSRGLLDETLVLWTGDFGRTPTINKDAGRDHWPACQSVLLAGGGVRGGTLVGSSDKSGAYPLSDAKKPDHIMASVYAAMGFDPSTVIRDQLGRPMPIADAEPIRALFG